jgi:hypothetical protein
MGVKSTKIFLCKSLQNLPNLGFWVCKMCYRVTLDGSYVVVGDEAGDHGRNEAADGADAVADAHQGSGVVGRQLHEVDLRLWFYNSDIFLVPE